jgi:hypothetical protein
MASERRDFIDSNPARTWRNSWMIFAVPPGGSGWAHFV